jgi:hypothetical protein
MWYDTTERLPCDRLVYHKQIFTQDLYWERSSHPGRDPLTLGEILSHWERSSHTGRDPLPSKVEETATRQILYNFYRRNSYNLVVKVEVWTRIATTNIIAYHSQNELRQRSFLQIDFDAERHDTMTPRELHATRDAYLHHSLSTLRSHIYREAKYRKFCDQYYSGERNNNRD